MKSFAKFLEDALNEMSFSRSKVEDKFTDISDPMRDHFVKILRYDSPNDELKHYRDILGWYMQLYRLDMKSKPKEKFFFQWIFPSTYRGDLPYIIKVMDLQYENIKKKMESVDVIYNKMENIFKVLANNLYKHKSLSIEDLQEIVKNS